MFNFCRAERRRVALAKRLLDEHLQYATAADTRKFIFLLSIQETHKKKYKRVC